MSAAVVWLKKDLRHTDHRPFFEATRNHSQVIALYIYEPEWFKSYEFDPSHLNFVNESLIELEKNLSKYNIQLVTRLGTAHEVFKKIFSETQFKALYAHQETGVAWTFYRDLQIIEFCKSHSIQFKEYYQFAVIRKLKNRDLWNNLKTKIIERKIIPDPITVSQSSKIKTVGILTAQDLDLAMSTKINVQKGGCELAQNTLTSFLDERVKNYLQHISSPWHSEVSSSRLSPYLTFGNLSLTQIHHQLEKAKNKFSNQFRVKKNLAAFESRLSWHCHFIQKLETEFQIEFENVNRGFDGLRESEFNESYFQAWKLGQTGYPMVDATMRCLLQTGWINFRMRAMLVSFASYQLWLHWQKPAEFLARHFLDFEPGIHFSQFQMQSGVTGINMIRIYSPIKQALDQKKSGDFIRKYCPELSNIPDEYIHEPHLMPPFLLIEAGLKLGENYPYPIVEHKKAYDLAKKRIFEWKQTDDVRKLSKEVLRLHASRGRNRDRD